MTNKRKTTVGLIPGESIIQLVIKEIARWKVRVKINGETLTGQVVAINNLHEGTTHMFGTARVYLPGKKFREEYLCKDIPIYIDVINGTVKARS